MLSLPLNPGFWVTALTDLRRWPYLRCACWGGGRFFVMPPSPRHPLPFKAHLPSSVSGNGQRGGDKEEPQVGKKETEKNSESLVRVKERGPQRDPGI